MGWFSGLLEGGYQKTFEQELELLIARWTDETRKGREALPIRSIGTKLLDKAEQLLDEVSPRAKP